MSVIEDIESGKHRYYAIEEGVVVDNVDPLGLHRVRVTVAGIIERSPWAWPVATQGGGSMGRGASTVPNIGADVAVWFIGGDIERPVYAGAWWGNTDAGVELPVEVAAAPPEERHLIQSIHESSKIKVWVDERQGVEQLAIQSKDVPENFIQINIAQGVIQISALAAVVVRSLGRVSLEGSEVYIQGRLVIPGPSAIG